MNNKLYTSGEFAKLCSTTKDTLLVYDRKGILKPEIIGENGYRYYTSDQYLTFGIIKSLQTTGTSLSEISDILHSNNSEDFIHLLEANRASLAKQQTELMRMQGYIDKILSSSEMMYYKEGELHLKYFPEEYMIVTPSGYKEPPKEGYYYSWESVSRHNDYMIAKDYPQYGLVDMFDLVSAENFEKDEFYPSYYWSKIPFKTNDPALRIKPAGTYATMNFYDSWENLPENYTKFKAAIKERGYKYTGDCYQMDILFSLLLSGRKSHGYTLSIKIEL